MLLQFFAFYTFCKGSVFLWYLQTADSSYYFVCQRYLFLIQVLLCEVNIIVPDENDHLLSVTLTIIYVPFLHLGDTVNHVEHVSDFRVIFTFIEMFCLIYLFDIPQFSAFLADSCCVWNLSRQMCCFLTLWVTALIPSVKGKCLTMNVSLQAKWCALKQSQKNSCLSGFCELLVFYQLLLDIKSQILTYFKTGDNMVSMYK